MLIFWLRYGLRSFLDLTLTIQGFFFRERETYAHVHQEQSSQVRPGLVARVALLGKIFV